MKPLPSSRAKLHSAMKEQLAIGAILLHLSCSLSGGASPSGSGAARSGSATTVFGCNNSVHNSESAVAAASDLATAPSPSRADLADPSLIRRMDLKGASDGDSPRGRITVEETECPNIEAPISKMNLLADAVPKRYNNAKCEPDLRKSFFVITTSATIVNDQNYGGFLYEIPSRPKPSTGPYSFVFTFCAWSKTGDKLTLRISNQDGSGEDTNLSNVVEVKPKRQRFTWSAYFDNISESSRLRSKIYGWLIKPHCAPDNKECWQVAEYSASQEFAIGDMTLTTRDKY